MDTDGFIIMDTDGLIIASTDGIIMVNSDGLNAVEYRRNRFSQTLINSQLGILTGSL